MLNSALHTFCYCSPVPLSMRLSSSRAHSQKPGSYPPLLFPLLSCSMTSSRPSESVLLFTPATLCSALLLPQFPLQAPRGEALLSIFSSCHTAAQGIALTFQYDRIIPFLIVPPYFILKKKNPKLYSLMWQTRLPKVQPLSFQPCLFSLSDT